MTDGINATFHSHTVERCLHSDHKTPCTVLCLNISRFTVPFLFRFNYESSAGTKFMDFYFVKKIGYIKRNFTYRLDNVALGVLCCCFLPIFNTFDRIKQNTIQNALLEYFPNDIYIYEYIIFRNYKKSKQYFFFFEFGKFLSINM